MNARDFLNTTVEFTLGSVTLKLSRLGTLKKMAITQADIIERAIEEITKKADALPADQRAAYMLTELDKAPSGKALFDRSNELLDKADLRIICKLVAAMTPESDRLTADEVEAVFAEATATECEAVMWFLRTGKKNCNSRTPV